MAGHSFNCEGGEALSRMGATWFVSYCYSDHVDASHVNFRNIKTWPSRASRYKQTNQLHIYWLTEILKMNNTKLKSELIGLKAVRTKQMAKQLLELI